MVLMHRNGGYSANPTAQPAWVQLRFPKVAGAAAVDFRFELDTRYRPLLRGGNPCSKGAANLTHTCNICTSGQFS